jgi:flagellar assembly protein FliH
MTAIKKFMFDVTFDAEEASENLDVEVENEDQSDEEEILEDIIEEEILPTFSEDELEAAKKEAYETGMQDGTQQSSETIERETLNIIRIISQSITELFGIQEQANNRMVSDGVGIASAIIRKLFPDLNENNGVSEIERLIETTLLRLIEEPRVVIRVNPVLTEAIDKRIDGLKAGSGYEGRIVLKEDEKISLGDCRIEWGDGSAERNSSMVWQAIDEIVSGHLGEMIPEATSKEAVELTVRHDADVTIPPDVQPSIEEESESIEENE